MDIYSYFNSKTVGEYCRSIGYGFNTYETAFIINDCRSISIDKKVELFSEVMRTMPDYKDERIKRDCGNESLFYVLKNSIIHDDYIHALSFFKKEGNGLVYHFGYYSNDCESSFDDKALYSSYDKALSALKDDINDREDEKVYGFYITARKPDSDKYIQAFLTDELEINRIRHNFSDQSMLFECKWVYIPTPFKNGDILIPTAEYRGYGPMVLNGICYADKDEKWLENARAEYDSSDMTAYGYWLGKDGYLYDECVHDYHNLEYFTGEFCTCTPHTCRFTDYRLLKAVSASMKGEIPTPMLLVASDSIRREKEYRQSFPGWDYTEEAYKKAGIEDILTKRRLWEEYDEERYNKGDG